MKRIFTYLVLLVVFVVAGGAYFIWQQYETFLNKPLLANEETVFTIQSGSNIRNVAKQLQTKGLFASQSPELITPDLFFMAHARLEKKAAKIKAGEYALQANMLPDELLDLFVSGKTLQYQIGFIEGRSFKEIVAAVKKHPHLEQTLSDEDYNNIMVKLGADPNTKPEGWFFPDTYNFPRNTTDFDVLKRSYETMRTYLQSAWEKRQPNPYLKTPYEALTLASIVEKETGVPEERPLIAGVFLNRLKKGMLLQTDPTVIYGMGDRYKGNIRKKDLRTDTPYNTYTRKGLPPTPIATPGKAAIDAVFNPQKSDMLYFVATGMGDGKHYFSKTYREHRKAVIKYQLNGKKSRYQGDK
ncbi:MAG: endolytic transglycosylase MltG [Thiolinea sp.]